MNVLFREDLECDWEHIIVYDNNGHVIDDGLESHKLSAKEVLTLLAKCGIITLTIEEIKE